MGTANKSGTPSENKNAPRREHLYINVSNNMNMYVYPR